MSAIKNYSLVVEHSAENLVTTVTNACKQGFLPIGGISITNEPAKPSKGQPLARMVYAQAMVRPYTAEDAIGQVVTRVNGR